MGQVYKAVQPSLNRVVAIKVLPGEFAEDETRVERFNREAKAVALLNHPNIVQIIDKDQDKDTLFFVMEYVPGSSLDDVLQQRRLSLQEAFTVFRGVCRGLEAAHRQTVIHRDLNPRNILVSDDLTIVKLADFGISKVETISREMGTLSTAESSIGTLHYMAPEQAVSSGTVDHRADIYSAGVVLYEMLTGRVPVGRFNLPSQLNSEVPSEIDPIVLKCLATDPKDRYGSVSDLIQAVELLEDQLRLGLVNELKGISRSTSKIFKSSTQTLTRNRKVLIGAGAGVLLLAAIGIAALVFRSSEPEPAPQQVAEVARGAAFQVEAVPRFDPEAVDSQLDLGKFEPEGEPTEEPAQPEPPAARAAEPEPEPEVEAPQPTPEPKPAPQRSTTNAGDREYKVALDKLKAGLFDPAIKDFEEFLQRFPNSSRAPGAYLAIAECHVGAGRTQAALAAFVEVQSRFPSARETAQATYRHGELLIASDRGRAPEAIEIFERAAVKFPNSNWAPLALLAKASLELAEKIQVNDPVTGGRVPRALITYRNVTELYGSTPHAEKALRRLAELYANEKRHDLAAQAWEKLGTSFPNTKIDCWWEAGQLYDKKLDNDQRAIAAYRKVPKSSRNYDAARKRINKLSR